jgi:ribosomal protein S18 acetylase RimI-like enzyme
MKITPYTIKDNEAALDIEEQCVQGESIVLKYRRPTFHARSQVYDKYRILCVKIENKLVGITAWAEKLVRLHGELIRAAYTYDLRVHPDYREKGVAIHLSREMFNDIGQDVDCIYTLIAGENKRALGLAQKIFGMKLNIPFTYAIIPIYKKFKQTENYFLTNIEDVHKQYLQTNNQTEFIPMFKRKNMVGHVSGIILTEENAGGCSLWTNENLLAEQVVSIPRSYQIQRFLSKLLHWFIKLPYIPGPADIIPSWFLYDMYAGSEKDFRILLVAVNNFAYEKERKYLYALLQNNDRLLTFIKRTGYKVFTFPYYFLGKGRITPLQTDKIYIDIRDL